MAKSVYVRTQPHLNIGTMGHVGHGKTTLTAALTKVLAESPDGGTTRYVPTDRIDRAPEEVARGITINIAHVEYETGTRHYAHADLPGHAGLVRTMVAGAAQLDGAILVVCARDGVMAQTSEHVLLARQVGVDHIVVALNKTDAVDDERADRVERQVRALLTVHGYAGQTAPVVRVSALGALRGEPRWTAAVEALLDAVDTYVPIPERYVDAPFLLPVERVLTVVGRGTVVTGTVERGTVRIGDRVAIVGSRWGSLHRSPVGGLESFGKLMDEGRAGESVALLLRQVRRDEVCRGNVIVGSDGPGPRRRFTAQVRLLPTAEGGRHTPFATGYQPQFHLRTAAVSGAVDLGGPSVARPGETVTMTVELSRALPLETGLGFAIRDGGRTVGTGTVTRVIG